MARIFHRKHRSISLEAAYADIQKTSNTFNRCNRPFVSAECAVCLSTSLSVSYYRSRSMAGDTTLCETVCLAPECRKESCRGMEQPGKLPHSPYAHIYETLHALYVARDDGIG